MSKKKGGGGWGLGRAVFLFFWTILLILVLLLGLIYVMEKGHIVESGSHEALMAKEDGYYRALYQAQVGE